jgi:hypothetical protein
MTMSPFLRTLVATAAAFASLLTASTAAHADPHPTHPGLVSADPANTTPDVVDGHVNAFAQVGDTMIVGGDFSEVEQGDTVYQRDHVFAFTISTGHVLTSFAPDVDGEVFDLQLAGGGRVLLAGAFSSVDGAPKTAKVAMVSISDGEVDPAFTSPMPNGIVRDVVVANGYYYIAGAFKTLGGHARGYLAALNSDGSDSGVATLDIAGTNAGGSTNVRAMDVSPDGTQIVIAGNFATVDGEPRGQLALLDVNSADTTLSVWATQRFAITCGPHFDAYMRDVAFAPSGHFFAVVATGGPLGVQKSGRLCDSASRWDVTNDPHAEPAWVDYTGGDTLTATIVDEGAVYVGGHQRWLNNSYGHNDSAAGAVSREGVAALDPKNGLPYTWNPGRRRGYGVYGFALTEAGLWVGSDTVGFGGELRSRIAFCPIVGGIDLPTYQTASIPGHLALLQRTGGVRVRAFDGHQVGPVGTVSSGEWAGLRGAFVVDDVLYAGWADGTMTTQSFDGTAVGQASTLDLSGGFTDLDEVQTMFFDATTHRIYYTLKDKNRLYYRYFQPQSMVVGSWRFATPAGGALDWRQVGEAFLVNRKLFFANAANGNLRRIGWDPISGEVTAPAVTVLGPAIDGNDYRAAGLVGLG